MKHVHEIFTVEREVNFSTGENYYLSHLTGGVILLDEDVICSESSLVGAPEKKVFTFECVAPGKAAIQFAYVQTPGGPVLYEEILPICIEELETCNPRGGWSDPHPLSAKEEEVFNKVTAGWCGAGYTPQNVATQVVSGINYRYVCKAVTVTLQPQEYYAMVYIYQPTEGDPLLTKIVPFLND